MWVIALKEILSETRVHLAGYTILSRDRITGGLTNLSEGCESKRASTAFTFAIRSRESTPISPTRETDGLCVSFRKVLFTSDI